jgi:threonine/homoserine/homoserine lactone efflux protein
MLLIIHYSIQYGKQAGRFTAPGVLIGDIIALIATFMGLGALLKISPNLFSTLKIAGGTYLITLGVAALRSKASNIQEEVDVPPKPPGRRLFTHMIVVTAFNPQNLVFLLAFFPQFISPEDDYLQQFFIMGVGYTIVGVVIAVLFNLMAHKIGSWIKKPSIKKYIQVLTGVLLCGIGLATILL